MPPHVPTTAATAERTDASSETSQGTSSSSAVLHLRIGAVEHRDLRAACGEQRGGGRADAARATGDHRDQSLELGHDPCAPFR